MRAKARRASSRLTASPGLPNSSVSHQLAGISEGIGAGSAGNAESSGSIRSSGSSDGTVSLCFWSRGAPAPACSWALRDHNRSGTCQRLLQFSRERHRRFLGWLKSARHQAARPGSSPTGQPCFAPAYIAISARGFEPVHDTKASARSLHS